MHVDLEAHRAGAPELAFAGPRCRRGVADGCERSQKGRGTGGHVPRLTRRRGRGLHIGRPPRPRRPSRPDAAPPPSCSRPGSCVRDGSHMVEPMVTAHGSRPQAWTHITLPHSNTSSPQYRASDHNVVSRVRYSPGWLQPPQLPRPHAAASSASVGPQRGAKRDPRQVSGCKPGSDAY